MSAVQVFWKHRWEKEKLLITSNFSFSQIVFYPFWELFAIFIKLKIVTCKLVLVRKSLKFIIWEKVKQWYSNKKSLESNKALIFFFLYKLISSLFMTL